MTMHDQNHIKNGKVVNLMHRSPLLPGNIPSTHSC